MVFLERKPDFYRIKVEVHVSDIQHLLNIITSIEADTDIAEIVRYRDVKNSDSDLGLKIVPIERSERN